MNKNEKKRTHRPLLSLFLTFFKIGLFTFGGGYAMIPLIQNEVADKKKWIDGKELLDIITISESTPGPISVNSATYIGCKVGGFTGSAVATLGLVMPSFFIIYIISLFFGTITQYSIVANAFKGIQVAVGFLIVSASVKLFRKMKRDVCSLSILALTTAAMLIIDIFGFNFPSIYIIIAGGVFGFSLAFISYINSKKKPGAANDGNGTDKD